MNERMNGPLPGLPERLRALPPLEPPPRVWAAVRVARARRRDWLAPLGVALAASLVMSVALVTLERPEPPVAGVDEVSQLASRSGQLEQTLRALRPASAVLDLQTAGTIVELEDRIARVDMHLRRASLASPETSALWQQRVELMQALVGVHATSGHYVF